MSDFDRLRAGLLRTIEAATRGTRFHRLVRAQVAHVLGDGRVDTTPETAGTPQHQELPLRFGVPGVSRAIVSAGARVLLAWAEGDPAQPFVAAWDGGEELQELVFNTAGGHDHLARTNDATADGTIVFTAGGSKLTITYTPPGGPAQVVTLGIAGVTGGGTLTLRGRITGTSRIQG